MEIELPHGGYARKGSRLIAAQMEKPPLVEHGLPRQVADFWRFDTELDVQLVTLGHRFFECILVKVVNLGLKHAIEQ